ncbi:MAG: hypothetical protein M5U34_03210 [Chloroflexi bacterium]|nr:hypothetical protein [Chloroflexota bacterium]
MERLCHRFSCLPVEGNGRLGVVKRGNGVKLVAEQLYGAKGKGRGNGLP